MKKNVRISRKAARRSFLAGVYLSVITAFIVVAVILIVHMTARTTSADDHTQRYKYYTSITVKKGDSLWTIAERYAGEEYQDLRDYINEVMELNGLKHTDIKAGHHLCVPYYSEDYK